RPRVTLRRPTWPRIEPCAQHKAQAVSAKALVQHGRANMLGQKAADVLAVGFVPIEIIEVVSFVEGPDARLRLYRSSVPPQDFELLLRTIAGSPQVHHGGGELIAKLARHELAVGDVHPFDERVADHDQLRRRIVTGVAEAVSVELNVGTIKGPGYST